MKRYANEPAANDCSTNESFAQVLDLAMSRRQALGVGLSAFVAGSFGLGVAQPASGAPADDVPGVHELFRFQGVPVSTDDTVHVPAGYVCQVLYPWGHPINNVGPKFDPKATNTAAEQAKQAGMGHDGMEWFPHPESPGPDRGLLCINHEYTDQGLLFPDGAWESITPARLEKSQAAHGVSVIEVVRKNGVWEVVDSKFARRITANTEVRISGPGAKLVGEKARGTLANCAAGKTPWGTYLTCEENYFSMFGTDDVEWEPNPAEVRYGMVKNGFWVEKDGKEVPVYFWWKGDPRFDLKETPTEPNRFGYVVEIDPTDPQSTPVKRTALGRFRHENAAVTLAADGRIVVYMGDDERNEYIYKFVSRDKYDPENRAANLNLLDAGTLYAARFDADLSGQWLKLVPKPNDANLADAAHVCVFTRFAADAIGATRMDRPEWLAVHPTTGEVYVTLTNNSLRGFTSDSAQVAAHQKPPADGPPVDRANPRQNNVYGHIVRWREAGGDAASLTFRWDVFLLAGDPQLDEQTPSVDIRGDAFGSPDGLWFDPRGILWIQTDVSTRSLGKGHYKYLGNNMMLAADPQRRTVRRFMTGPRGCEVTGVTMTPDRKTLFVNIQHPGEPSDEVSDGRQPCKVSTWPDGKADGRPRPATVAIYRTDGGDIGE